MAISYIYDKDTQLDHCLVQECYKINEISYVINKLSEDVSIILIKITDRIPNMLDGSNHLF